MAQKRTKQPTETTKLSNATSQSRFTQEGRSVRPHFILATCLTTFLSTSLFCAPEGAIREGDYLPIALLFFVMCSFSALFFYLYPTSYPKSRQKKEQDRNSQPRRYVKRLRQTFPVLADFSLGFCLLLYTISCLKVVLFHTGDVRLGLNGYWSFATPILFYFTLRCAKRHLSERLIFELFFTIIVCVIAESVFSAYSYAIVNPKTREAYLANPDKTLADNGMKFEKGSRERFLFEQRLLNSVEPTGSYGLANTLAGVVAPVLVLLLTGIPWRFWGTTLRRFSWFNVIFSLGILLTLFLEFFVLLATKSRSACIALVFGLAFWGIFKIKSCKLLGGQRVKIRYLFVVVVLTVLLLAGGVTIFSGAVDREVLTEASKSFGYRLEYWLATSRMVCDYPILGIGPGEFQNIYPRYILPTSSEFIADPHNFAFEIAALFGIPALLFFVVFLLAIFISAWLEVTDSKIQTLSKKQLNSASGAQSGSNNEKLSATTILSLFIGLIATFFCACFQSVPPTLSFYGIAAITFILFYAIISISPLYRRQSNLHIQTLALTAALVTLLVNLCAAGGIGYAPISTILFFIAAILANRSFSCCTSVQKNTQKIDTENTFKNVSQKNNKRPIRWVILSLTILGSFYFSSYKPRTDAFLYDLRYSANPNCFAQYSKDLLLPKIDPASSTIASQRYFLAGLKYSKEINDTNLQEWNIARQEMEKASPNSASIRERCGDFDFLLYQDDKKRSEFLDAAIILYKESIDRSPTDLGKKEKLFTALKQAKRFAEAKEVARESLRFDATTPHEDRKLQSEIRKEMEEFVGKSDI